MTVQDALQKHLEARAAGDASGTAGDELVSAVDDLFQAVKKARLRYDLEWYATQLFVDGDHWLKFDKQAGRVTSSDSLDGTNRKKIRRSINLIRSQLRGLKNFVQKIPLTVEVVPNPKGQSPEEKQAATDEAKQKNAVWRGIEYDLKIRHKLPGMVEDGFIKYAGYMGILPSDDGYLEACQWDSYDVWPDPTAPGYQAGRFLFLTPRQPLADVKSNKGYDNTEGLKGEAKLAASDFKSQYEQSRMGGAKAQLDGDLATTILSQLLIKLPLALQPVSETVTKSEVDPTTGQPVEQQVEQPVMGPDGQPQQELVPSETPRLWIITTAEGKLLKVEETNLRRFPVVPYYPEKVGNRVYARAWLHHLKDLNKSVDNMYSSAEEYFIKNRSKLLVPTDSKLKEVSNVMAEVLTYDARNPDAIKEFKPAGLPPTLFQLMDLGQSLIGDVGGLHQASIGMVPTGVKSGRGIESLKASDAENNVAEPISNLGLFYEELAEVAFEILSDYATTQKTISFPDGDSVERVTFIGEAGTKLQDGTPAELPKDMVVISPSRVKVSTVPAVSYTEEGKKETLKELFEMKAIDTKTLLDGYRFQNVDDIVERVQAEAAQKATMPPPPPPVPGDKLLTALASLAKSGQPVSMEQLQAAMQDAGLPAMQIQSPVAPPQPVG